MVIAQGTAKRREVKQSLDANDFVIRRPKFAVILCMIILIPLLLAFFVFCVYAALDKNNGEWIYGVYAILPMLLFFSLLVIINLRWRIIIKGNQITSRPYFGKEKTFTFDYITKVNRGVYDVNGVDIDCMNAYHDKKPLFSITNECAGFHVLASRLESEGVPIVSGKKNKDQK